MAPDGQGATGATNEEVLQFIRDFKTQDRVASAEIGMKGAITKAAKSAGVQTAIAIKVARMSRRDHDEVRSEMLETVRQLTLLKIVNVADFAKMVQDLDFHVAARMAHEIDMFEAEDRGYRAGMAGAAKDENPYTTGSEPSQIWVKWLGRGAAEKQRRLGESGTQATADKAQPAGRKMQAGSGAPALQAAAKGKRKGQKKGAGRPAKRANGANGHANGRDRSNVLALPAPGKRARGRPRKDATPVVESGNGHDDRPDA